MKRAMQTLALLLGLWASVATAQPQGAPATQAPPVDLSASRNDQAARQLVQPLNNAPVWRAVNSPSLGVTNLPEHEGGCCATGR